MIRIEIFLDEWKNLWRVRAEGHSQLGAGGADIVCAAVSALLRSVVRVLDAETGLEFRCSADTPGMLEFEVRAGIESREKLSGISSVLLAGLLETEKDYPGECTVKLVNISS